MGQHAVLNGSHNVLFADPFTHLDLVVSEVIVHVSHLRILEGRNGTGLAPVVTVLKNHRSREESFLLGRD